MEISEILTIVGSSAGVGGFLYMIMRNFKKDMKEDIKELKASIKEVKISLKGDIKEITENVKCLRSDVDKLSGKMDIMIRFLFHDNAGNESGKSKVRRRINIKKKKEE